MHPCLFYTLKHISLKYRYCYEVIILILFLIMTTYKLWYFNFEYKYLMILQLLLITALCNNVILHSVILENLINLSQVPF